MNALVNGRKTSAREIRQGNKKTNFEEIDRILKVRFSTQKPNILTMNQENNTMSGQKTEYNSQTHTMSQRDEMALARIDIGWLGTW